MLLVSRKKALSSSMENHWFLGSELLVSRFRTIVFARENFSLPIKSRIPRNSYRKQGARSSHKSGR